MASLGLTSEEQKAVEDFRKNIVEPSKTKLVILDFWAEWCGPCKALTPVLEKVCGEYADKGVMLAKVNVDEEKFIASQFQIQSIPTVFAFFQGQPVANISQARSESQLRSTLDQLLSQLPVQGGDADGQPDIEPLLAMGEEVLESGDAGRALSIFGQIIEMAPENVPAVSGLLRSLIASGDLDSARELLDGLEEPMKSDPLLDQPRSQLELAANTPDSEALAELQREYDANPQDMQKRLDYANALIASGARDEGAEHLLAMIREDNEWNEGAARKALLQHFEAIGLEDSWVSATRRKLSAALFG